MHTTTVEPDLPLVNGGRQNRRSDSDQPVNVTSQTSSCQDIRTSAFIDKASANAGSEVASGLGILAKFVVSDTGEIVPAALEGEIGCGD
jgi:hypothetical protein